MSNEIIAFIDYNSPESYIGKAMITELKKEYKIREDYIAKEVYPSIPVQGGEAKTYLKDSTGKDLIDALEEKAKTFKVKLSHIDKVYNSHLCLLLSQYAKNKKKIKSFSNEVFKAVFTNDLDISSEPVLKDIFEKCKLDFNDAMESVKDGKLQRVYEKGEELAKTCGVKIIPSFIVNGQYIIEGATNLDEFREILKPKMA